MVNHYRATVYKTVNYDGKKWALNHPGDSETPVGTLAEVAEHYLAYLKAQGVRRNFAQLSVADCNHRLTYDLSFFWLEDKVRRDVRFDQVQNKLVGHKVNQDCSLEQLGDQVAELAQKLGAQTQMFLCYSFFTTTADPVRRQQVVNVDPEVPDDVTVVSSESGGPMRDIFGNSDSDSD